MAEEKIKVFKKLFRGRQDIVPRYWISKDGEKQGYTPLCRNEWREGLCEKPCRTCENAEYIPLSDKLILNHLRGRHIIGVYPLLKGNVCNFIAGDFDDHNGDRNPLADVIAFYEVCQVQEIPIYVFRSKSGKGYHTYIYFSRSVPSWKARKVNFALLQEADVIGEDVKLSSFDRLFPNQDILTRKGFGNLIALPFQGKAAKHGHTLFLNPDTEFAEPYNNQLEILSNIEKVDESILDDLIESWGLKRSKHKINSRGNNNHNKQATARLLSCKFISWCKSHPEKVSEPQWYSLISNLISIRPGGVTLCHELSKGHPDYSNTETDRKILQALDASGPHTCDYINSNGFNCDNDCGVRSPASLALVYANVQNGDLKDVERQRIKVSFEQREEGCS